MLSLNKSQIQRWYNSFIANIRSLRQQCMCSEFLSVVEIAASYPSTMLGKYARPCYIDSALVHAAQRELIETAVRLFSVVGRPAPPSHQPRNTIMSLTAPARPQSVPGYVTANNPPDIDKKPREWRVHGRWKPQDMPPQGSHSCQNGITRQLTREWRPYLDHTELSLLLLILDQTFGMNRRSWGFTYGKLGHGDKMTAGTGLSKRHLIDLVDNLERLGLITTLRNSKGIDIVPDLDWQPGPDTPTALERAERRSVERSEKRKVVRPAAPHDEVHVESGEAGCTGLAPMGAAGRTTSGEAGRTHKRTRQVRDRSIEENEARGHLSATAAPAPAKETSVPVVRQRQRPVANGASWEKDASGEKERFPVPAAALSLAPDKTAIRLTPEAIDQTLRRAVARYWPNAITPWPNERRIGVAQLIAARWSRTGTGPQMAHRFADWLIWAWSDIELTYAAPEYPEADFIGRKDRLLLADFVAHFDSAAQPNFGSKLSEGGDKPLLHDARLALGSNGSIRPGEPVIRAVHGSSLRCPGPEGGSEVCSEAAQHVAR